MIRAVAERGEVAPRGPHDGSRAGARARRLTSRPRRRPSIRSSTSGAAAGGRQAEPEGGADAIGAAARASSARRAWTAGEGVARGRTALAAHRGELDRRRRGPPPDRRASARAPSATADRPISSGSIRGDMPLVLRRATSTTSGAAEQSAGVLHDAGSPLCASIIRSTTSGRRAARDRGLAGFARASAALAAAPPAISISAPRASVHSTRSAGPARRAAPRSPRASRCALPTVRPSGRAHVA